MKDGSQTVSRRQKCVGGGVKTLNNITTEGNHRLKRRLWWGSQSGIVRVTTTSTQRKLCTLVLQGAQMANNCFQRKTWTKQNIPEQKESSSWAHIPPDCSKETIRTRRRTCLREYQAIPQTASSFSTEVSHTFKFSTAATLSAFSL